MKKKIILFFTVIALIIVSIFVYFPKVNADNNVVIEYDEYNYIISITEIDSDYIYFYVVSHISNNVWSDSPSSDLSYAENNDLITSYGTYLVNASLLNNTSAIYYYYMYISTATNLFTYLNTVSSGISNNSYSIGYTTGYANGVSDDAELAFNAGKQDAYNSLTPGNPYYNEIYNKGYYDSAKSYEVGGSNYNTIYDKGYQKALNEFDSYLGDDNTDITFLSMFKAITQFITDFFVVGLNVEIFGINIGEFCVGIFLISAIMFLLKLIFGR